MIARDVPDLGSLKTWLSSHTLVSNWYGRLLNYALYLRAITGLEDLHMWSA